MFPNGEIFSQASASSDGVMLVFDPLVSGERRAASTGSDVRDRCRDLIVKALKKGFCDGKILNVCI